MIPYFFSSPWELICVDFQPMGMTNKHIGYVYLVDENCKIRWAAVSFAHTETKEVDEVQALATCARILLQRLREGTNNTG